MKKRAQERSRAENKSNDCEEEDVKPKKKDNKWYTDTTHKPTPQERDKIEKEKFDKEKAYWQEPTVYTPESRIELHKHIEKQKSEKEVDRLGPNPKPRQRRLQTDDGVMLNINECKFEFRLTEDEELNCLLLDIPLYKHLSTTLVDADIQPHYVRVTVKGKIFQLVLPEEIFDR